MRLYRGSLIGPILGLCGGAAVGFRIEGVRDSYAAVIGTGVTAATGAGVGYALGRRAHRHTTVIQIID